MTVLFVYADDTALFYRGKVAHIALKEFTEVAKKFDLEINLGKAKYIASNQLKHIDAQNIERVKQFKYLG